MKSSRSINSEKDDRLSRFGQRLQSLSESFYSTILEEPKEKKIVIQNAKDLEELNSTNFTFDEYSNNDFLSNENFSFTFHSIEQQPKKKNKSQVDHRGRQENLLSFDLILDNTNK